jgi:hypothetical protein
MIASETITKASGIAIGAAALCVGVVILAVALVLERKIRSTQYTPSGSHDEAGPVLL